MKYLKSISAMALVILFMPLTSQAQQNELVEVSPIKAKLMVRNGALMVDVREVGEVSSLAYDVESIVNIPLSELESRLSEIPKDKTLIMACRSGSRSRKAAIILMQNGYEDLVNLEGGIMAWQAKKLEVIINGKSTKKACCANPNSKDCNPDGTCKKSASTDSSTSKKSCCSAGQKKGKACCGEKKSN